MSLQKFKNQIEKAVNADTEKKYEKALEKADTIFEKFDEEDIKKIKIWKETLDKKYHFTIDSYIRNKF